VNLGIAGKTSIVTAGVTVNTVCPASVATEAMGKSYDLNKRSNTRNGNKKKRG
jgi:NAD(P)-dependent dehydrogenase (short-subunit alcohol dehydrogenase family)